MFFDSLRLIALAAALLHLADPVLSCAVHRHGDGPGQHRHPRSAQHGCSHHHAARHDHGNHNDKQSSPSECPDDCAICRHLAQPALPAAVTPPVLQFDLVCGIAEASCVSPRCSRALAYQSRAPPGLRG